MTPAEAAERVEIGYFWKKGYKIKGVVHVGANNGYEIGFYREMGCSPILAFEPLHSAFVELHQKFASCPDVKCFPWALGRNAYVGLLKVAPGDGMGSSFLYEHSNQYPVQDHQMTAVFRFESHFSALYYNALVVDVQGMELDVLEGFGNELQHMDFLNIECSRDPLFDGEAPAQQVIDFLDAKGFQQETPILDHGDILFIRKGLKP